MYKAELRSKSRSLHWTTGKMIKLNLANSDSDTDFQHEMDPTTIQNFNLLKIKKPDREIEEADSESKPLLRKAAGIVVEEVCKFIFQDFL